MNIDLQFLAVAIALLWLPFPTMSTRFRVRSFQTKYVRPDLGRIFGNWQNYVDFIRSLAGAYVLIRHAAPAPLGGPQGLPEIWVPAAVLLIGVLIQTARSPAPAFYLAPVFYLAGLTVEMPGYLEGGFALIFGWAFACGIKDLRFQLPAMGLALLAAGFFNANLSLWLLLNLALIFTPNLLALVANSRLIFVTRESRSGQGTPTIRPEAAIQLPSAPPGSSNLLNSPDAKAQS